MRDIIETGRTLDGVPVFGYAPDPQAVPTQFRLDLLHLECKRDGCTWRHNVNGDTLTEIVALAREHLAEAHRG